MNSFGQYLIDEFVEDYLERRLTRRDALRRLAAVMGSTALATSILAACGPQRPPEPSLAPLPTPTAVPTATPTPAGPGVSPDDPAIQADRAQFPGQGATLRGYLARPRGGGPFAGVLVCHENRGLVEHIADVTRRLAKAGYVSLAVDLLSREGGTDKVSDAQVPGILGNTPPDRFIQDFQGGLSYLQGQPYVRRDRIGMVGFCFGGGVTWLAATKIPELRAAVPFYGPNPPLEDVPNIQAAVLAIYGALDNFVNPGIPAIEARMKEHNKTFEKIIYPNAGHAFHNDTGRSYNPEAAKDAWSKTLAWFEKYLRS